MKTIFLFCFFVSSIGFSQTFSGTSGPILDNQTLTRTVNVSGLPNSINTTSFGLEQVCFDVTHTYDADIVITLTAPDGTSFELINGTGGADNDFSNTCFRDDASVSINAGNAPFTGIFKPVGQMGIVNNNQNPNGTWTLTASDNYNGDEGTLNNWSITFGNNPATPLIFTSSNLPIILINTNGNPIPDEPKLQASMKIIDNGPGATNFVTDFPNAYNNLIGIEQRGSSSAGFPQKSYGLETRNVNGTVIDTILLNMPKEHDWILYAPYNDKTCLRNILTYDLANRMGNYAARTKLCELVVNGEYRGIYVLMEKIKRDGDRVNISKLNPIDIAGDELTGGYIVKIDKSTGNGNDGWTSNFPSMTNTPIDFFYHYPNAATIEPQQQAYIQAYVDSFEMAVNGPNANHPTLGYRNFTIPETFVDFFILNEISRNVDGYRLSTFLHKEKDSKGGKLRMGPVWDFNLAWWNADYCDGNLSTGWAYRIGDVCQGGWQVPTWWENLLDDPWFQDELKCRWTTLRQGALSQDSLFLFMDSIANYIDTPKDRHFEQWPLLGTYTWPNPSPIASDYAGEIANMKGWLQDRIAWLDANMPGTCNLGLNETETISQVTVSPNPFTSELKIGFFNAGNGEQLMIELKDLNGKVVATRKVQQLNYGMNEIEFQLETPISSGYYLMTLISNNSSQTVRLIAR